MLRNIITTLGECTEMSRYINLNRVLLCFVLVVSLVNFGCETSIPNSSRTGSAPKTVAPRKTAQTGNVKFEILDFTYQALDMSSARVSGKVTDCAYEIEEYRLVMKSNYAVRTCSVCGGSGKRSDEYFNCAVCGGTGRMRQNIPRLSSERIRAYWKSIELKRLQISSTHFVTEYLTVTSEGLFNGALKTKGGSFVIGSNISTEGQHYLETHDFPTLRFTLKPETSVNIRNLKWSTELASPNFWIPR